MEPINIVDYGHHTIKCGRVFAGKGAATKAARAAAAAADAGGSLPQRRHDERPHH
jgi:hypothetical protein